MPRDSRAAFVACRHISFSVAISFSPLFSSVTFTDAVRVPSLKSCDQRAFIPKASSIPAAPPPTMGTMLSAGEGFAGDGADGGAPSGHRGGWGHRPHHLFCFVGCHCLPRLPGFETSTKPGNLIFISPPTRPPSLLGFGELWPGPPLVSVSSWASGYQVLDRF